MHGADGDEGTARVLLEAVGGVVETVAVHDALGRDVLTEYVVIDDGRVAVLDAAQSAGLWRIGDVPLDPWNASTAGVGELIAGAAKTVDEVIVCAGGTATVDGGAGRFRF